MRASLSTPSTPSRSTVVLFVGLLFVTNFLNWYDRSLFAILLQPMKLELGFTDVQAGLLTGLAYNLLSLLAILPIARISDRGSHRNVLLASLIFWSAATALCGLAGGFLTLFVYRMLVGLGEAGAQPATHALVSASLPSTYRARALSIIGIGSGAGVLGGGWLGGTIGEHFGWRAAFLSAGVLGFFAAAALMMVKTGQVPSITARRDDTPAPPLRQAVISLVIQPSYRWLLVAVALASVGYYALNGWLPTYFARVYGLSTGQAGTAFAVCCIAPLLVGTVAGGFISDKWSVREPRTPLYLLMLSYGGSALFFFAVYRIHDIAAALVVLAIGSFILGLYVGPIYSLVQALAQPRTRATSTALMVLVSGIFGGTIGPAVIGYINDGWQGAMGDQVLRLSMTCILVAPILSMWPAWQAARYVRQDLERLELASAS